MVIKGDRKGAKEKRGMRERERKRERVRWCKRGWKRVSRLEREERVRERGIRGAWRNE